MKTLILTSILLLGIITTTIAQDQIITVNGDTVECSISKVSPRFIHFSYFENGEQRPSAMNINTVHSFSRDGNIQIVNEEYKAQLLTQASEENKKEKTKTNKSAYLRFKPVRAFLTTGYSSFTGGIANASGPQELRDHAESLNSGFNISGGIGGFFSNGSAGMGVKIHYMRTSASTSFTETVLLPGEIDQIEYTFINNRNTLFLGPNFISRSSLDDEGYALVHFGLSAGPIYYTESGESRTTGFINQSDQASDEQLSFGGIMEMHIEFSLSQSLMLSLGGSYFLNYVESIDVFNKDDGVRINLNHYNLGGGLVFTFN